MVKASSVGALLVTLVACANGGGGGPGQAGTGAAAGTTGSAGVTGSGGTAGTTSTGLAGTGGTTAAAGAGTGGGAGAPGAGNGGTTATDGGTGDRPSDVGGAAGTGAGGGGPKSCVGRVLSLAPNTTGTTKDVAHARVSIDLQDDLPLGNAPRTVEFWMYVRPTDWVAEVNEIFVYGTDGTVKNFGLDFGMPAVKGMPGNHATLGPYTNGIYDDDTGIYLGITSTDAQWLHVAMTWDAKALRTYVNGAVRITTMNAAMTPLQTARTVFTMGCNPPYFGCFAGLVDELRIWNRARTDAEIMATYDKALGGDEPGLVGYWKFDEAPGSATTADVVTTAGHVPHTGYLLSVGDGGAPPAPTAPTFVTPDPPPPLKCP